ncbi:MAG: pentapeptide repeat-containing protein [Caldilinea sp. CFX5]|nr:pentapeptide repeat-containing protein [Caldilinea sp. CFX5]
MNELIWLLIGVIGLAIFVTLLVWATSKNRSRSTSSATSTPPPVKDITDKEQLLEFLRSIKFATSKWERQQATVRNINLEGMDLRQADLKYCKLERVNLQSANLSKANLGEASLREVNLRYADLSEADLSGASIWDGTDFSGAELRSANLQHVHFYSNKMQGANLENADIQNTSFSATTDLSQTNLNGARYNFFTSWPMFDPVKIGAISVDGLGPNPMKASRDQWFYYKLMRKGTLVQIESEDRSNYGANLRTRDEITEKLNGILEDSSDRYSQLEKAISNWRNPSLEELYYRVAHDIRYHRNIFYSTYPGRPDIEFMLNEYYDAWIDVLEWSEYRQDEFRSDATHFKPEKAQAPSKFESPIEEMFWHEWQRQGGITVLDL